MIKLVIFDWAGTTVDYGCFAPVESFRKAFLEYGIEVNTEEIRLPMGMSKIDHIATMLEMPRIKTIFKNIYQRNVIQSDIEKINELFEKNLFSVLTDYASPIDGVLDVVEELRKRNIKIGSTTGYTSDMMEVVVKKAKEYGYSPDYVSTAQIAGEGRPSSLMIEDNMKYFNISDKAQVIKVGDTISDILEGKNANVMSIGVILGSSELGKMQNDPVSNEEKMLVKESFIDAGADVVLEKMSDLLELIDNIK